LQTQIEELQFNMVIALDLSIFANRNVPYIHCLFS